MQIEKLRKRFCKDCGYHINTYDDNYFFDKLSQIDGAIEKYDNFEEMIMKYKSPEVFLDEYDKICNKIISHIQSKPEFQTFNTMDMKEYIVQNQFPSKTIFVGNNIGKTLLSIDMQKANFSSLKYYSPNIFDNKNTWQDFVKQFTNNEYIISSKNIRQVIMGNCNPKRQGNYEKFLMNKLLDELSTVLDVKDIVFFSNDEIVFDIKNLENFTSKEEEIKNAINNTNLPFDVEVFKLCGVIDKSNAIQGYYKKHYNKEIEFKAIDPIILPIAQKTLTGQSLTEEDLVFDSKFGPVKLLNIPELRCVEELPTKDQIIEEER